VETRIKILQLLRDQRLCVNAVASRLGITAAAVSQHLRIMRDAGLVASDKEGYYVHYRLDEATIAEWRSLADDLLSVQPRQ